MGSFRTVAWIAVVAVAGPAFANGPNLLTNGDFAAGNTGFSTGYTFSTMVPPFQGGVHGIYVVEAASAIAGSSAYGDWTNITTDPTGGDGNVYVADGATTADTTVWSETITVTPNTKYFFSFYGAEVSPTGSSDATFLPTIDGTDGTVLGATGSWQQNALFEWNSGANTSAVISITDTNSSGPFNDFTIGDLSFTAAGVPEPATWALLIGGLSGLGAALRARRRGVIPFA